MRINKLKMYIGDPACGENCQTGNLDNAEWFEERVVNIPSGVRV